MNLAPHHRAWAYRVALAIIAIAGVYGFVNDQQTTAWIVLAAALFSSGLATANTSTSTDPSADA